MHATFQVVEVKSDATHDNAVEHSKVHIAKVTTAICDITSALVASDFKAAWKEGLAAPEGPSGWANPLDLQVLAGATRTIDTLADLQRVASGTSEELYNHHCKECCAFYTIPDLSQAFICNSKIAFLGCFQGPRVSGFFVLSCSAEPAFRFLVHCLIPAGAGKRWLS